MELQKIFQASLEPFLLPSYISAESLSRVPKYADYYLSGTYYRTVSFLFCGTPAPMSTSEIACLFQQV